MARLTVTTGKDLLDLGVSKFEVINGSWLGEVVIRNNKPCLYRKDYRGNFIESFPISDETELKLVIKPLSYEARRVINNE